MIVFDKINAKEESTKVIYVSNNGRNKHTLTIEKRVLDKTTFIVIN